MVPLRLSPSCQFFRPCRFLEIDVAPLGYSFVLAGSFPLIFFLAAKAHLAPLNPEHGDPPNPPVRRLIETEVLRYTCLPRLAL